MAKKTTITKQKENKTGKDQTKKAIEKQEDFKSWVELKFKEVMKHFLVDFCFIDFSYMDCAPDNRDGSVVFTVNANEKYHQMGIRIYPVAMRMWAEGKANQLIDGIVHECAHLHTDRLMKLAEDRFVTREQVMDANEYLTEVVAQYIRLHIKSVAPHIYNK